MCSDLYFPLSRQEPLLVAVVFLPYLRGKQTALYLSAEMATIMKMDAVRMNPLQGWMTYGYARRYQAGR